MTEISFFAPGKPVAKGSWTPIPRRGKRPVFKGPKGLRAWEWTMAKAAQAAMVGRRPTSDPVKVGIVFVFARPKSHFRAGRYRHLLKAGVPEVPSKDLDKLIRAVLDALTGVVYVDDKLVAVLADNTRKEYGTEPGAHVTVVFGACGEGAANVDEPGGRKCEQ
jgi:crossover junction endodeoxyribonuclease RusA